jgi:adenylate cyclase
MPRSRDGEAVMASGNVIASDAVRAELQRIVVCEEFDASERNRRFLQYVVEETLAGCTERIKAYNIATLVFGRGASFDPQTDPIIRIEAGRLRRSLEHYYLTAGKDDPIRIEIPKGSYVPTFRYQGEVSTAEHSADGSVTALSWVAVNAAGSQRQRAPWMSLGALAVGALLAVLIVLGIARFERPPAPSAQHQEMPFARRGPAIFVVPFSNDGKDAADDALIRGFTREVIVGLTRFEGLFVYGPDTSFRYKLSGGPEPSVNDLQVDFLVTGGVTISKSQFRAVASLIEAKTGRHLWSEEFQGELTADDIFQARESLANRVVQALAQPYGVIFRAQDKEIEGKPPDALSSYQCMLEFYNYWRSLSRSLHARAQKCLEKVVVQEPDYAEASSALAMVYANI